MNKKEQEELCALAAMKWHGWGSPIGLSIFMLTLALSVFIISRAFCS